MLFLFSNLFLIISDTPYKFLTTHLWDLSRDSCKNNFPILDFFSPALVGLKSCLSSWKSVETDSLRQPKGGALSLSKRLPRTEQVASAPLTPREKRKLFLHDSEVTSRQGRVLLLLILVKKTAHDFHEFWPGGFIFPQQVILTLKRDELRPGNEGGQ